MYGLTAQPHPHAILVALQKLNVCDIVVKRNKRLMSWSGGNIHVSLTFWALLEVHHSYSTYVTCMPTTSEDAWSECVNFELTAQYAICRSHRFLRAGRSMLRMLHWISGHTYVVVRKTIVVSSGIVAIQYLALIVVPLNCLWTVAVHCLLSLLRLLLRATMKFDINACFCEMSGMK